MNIFIIYDSYKKCNDYFQRSHKPFYMVTVTHSPVYGYLYIFQHCYLHYTITYAMIPNGGEKYG